MRSSESNARNERNRDENHAEARGTPRDLRWALGILLVSAFALWKSWVVLHPLQGFAPPNSNQSASCLTNLQQIGRGFALYASDWDGKFPRGKDAEDRAAPLMWQRQEPQSKTFYTDVMAEQMMPDLLQNYGVPRTAWHCPADVGWSVLSNASVGPQRLRNVRPSAWQKYGLSYSYLTEFGLRGLKSSELENASKAVLLFDDEFWHRDSEGGQRRGGALFADGQARMATPEELERLIGSDSPLNEP